METTLSQLKQALAEQASNKDSEKESIIKNLSKKIDSLNTELEFKVLKNFQAILFNQYI